MPMAGQSPDAGSKTRVVVVDVPGQKGYMPLAGAYLIAAARADACIREAFHFDLICTDGSESIDETVIVAPNSTAQSERILALENALRSLDMEDREIVTLKYFDGLSYNELAERLQIPKGTVMSRLFHARKKLQAKLERVVAT